MRGGEFCVVDDEGFESLPLVESESDGDEDHEEEHETGRYDDAQVGERQVVPGVLAVTLTLCSDVTRAQEHRAQGDTREEDTHCQDGGAVLGEQEGFLWESGEIIRYVMKVIYRMF